MTHTAPKFKGHPRLAGPGCWDVVQLMDPTVDPGFQHQKPDPCGSPLLLSAVHFVWLGCTAHLTQLDSLADQLSQVGHVMEKQCGSQQGMAGQIGRAHV